MNTHPTPTQPSCSLVRKSRIGRTALFAALTVGLFGGCDADSASGPANDEPTAGGKADAVDGDLDEALKANKEFVEIELGEVQRLEMIVRASELATLLGEMEAADISLEVDGYQQVYMEIPWTAKKVGRFFKEYTLVILEFQGDQKTVEQILGGAEENTVESYSIESATRGIVTLKGEDPELNPNPVKWYNRDTPGSENYRINLLNAFILADGITDDYTPATAVEVNVPMNHTSFEAFAASMRGAFPNVDIEAVDPGIEHFIDENGGDFASPSIRAEFDISELPADEHLLFLETIELYHSYKVPVMRVL